MKGSVRAMADMVSSGTIANYFRSSRRYGLFFLFTYMLLALFWGAGSGGGFLVHQWLAAFGAVAAALAGLAVTLAGGLLLMRWPGRRFRLKQSLDLAEFSVDFVHGRHPGGSAHPRLRRSSAGGGSGGGGAGHRRDYRCRP